MSQTEPQKTRTPIPRTPPWALVAAGLPVLGVALGGTTERWSQGVMLVLIGLAVLAFPPQRALGRATRGFLLALVLLAAAQLLPIGAWFHPGWNERLGPAFEGVLPSTLSLQPWVTAEALFLMCAAILWFCWVASLPWTAETRSQAMRWYACGVIVLASACLIFHWLNSPPAFWHSPRHFGPFPNRNHTGNVLGIGGVLVAVCAWERVRDRRRDGWLFAAGLAPVSMALVLNYSRGGILLFACGTALWLAGVLLIGRSTSMKPLALGATGLFVLLALFFSFGGELTERLVRPPEAEAGQGLMGFRSLVFADAAAMGREAPWTGVGLGNFNALFSLYREHSESTSRAVHPESDWVWLWTETGWPGLLCVLGALGSLGRRLWPFHHHKGWRWRLAAAVGALAFVFSGIIDVAGHRLGPILPALLLLALALREKGVLDPPTPQTGKLCRLSGLLPLALGVYWLGAVYGGKIVPGSIGVERTKAAVGDLLDEGEYGQALAMIDRATAWAPLDWQLAFQQATANAYDGRPFDALRDFRRVKNLEPSRADIRAMEGEVWMDTVPTFAMKPWGEALALDPIGAPERLRQYLRRVGPSPELRAELRTLAGRETRTLLVFLGELSPEEFALELAQLREADPDLARFNEAELAQFFAIWSRFDSDHELPGLIEARRRWQQPGWPWLAREQARRGEFETAYHLALSHIPAPTIPDYHFEMSLAALRTKVAIDPTHFGAACALARLEAQEGRLDNAWLTADRAANQKNAPLYLHFLAAQYAAEQGNWPKAWAALARYAKL